MLKRRRSRDRLILNMWIPILRRWHLYTETAPRSASFYFVRQIRALFFIVWMNSCVILNLLDKGNQDDSSWSGGDEFRWHQNSCDFIVQHHRRGRRGLCIKSMLDWFRTKQSFFTFFKHWVARVMFQMYHILIISLWCNWTLRFACRITFQPLRMLFWSMP